MAGNLDYIVQYSVRTDPAVLGWLLLLFFYYGFICQLCRSCSRGQRTRAGSFLWQARQNLTARRLKTLQDKEGEQVAATVLALNDLIEIRAGELIPADGEIVHGFATINEAAVTGESAPVLREAGTDRSGVIGGTKVLTDRIIVQVTAETGHSFWTG